MQSAVGILGVNGSTACFADLRREIIHSKASRLDLTAAKKKVTAKFRLSKPCGGSCRQPQKSEWKFRELVRTLNICNCGDYHEEAPGFLQPQPKARSPIYQISTAPSLRIVATLPNIPLGETTLFVDKSTYNRELLVFATTFYLLVRNRKTRRGIRAIFFAKVSSTEIISMSNRKSGSPSSSTLHRWYQLVTVMDVPHDIRQRSGMSHNRCLRSIRHVRRLCFK